MAAKIVLENELKAKIPHMDGNKYSNLLMLVIEENVLKDETLKKFSVCRRNQYYKYLLYIPTFEDGTKVTESEEQRNKRLELRNSLISKFGDNIAETLEADVMDFNKYISRNDVVRLLNISKKHFDVICNSSGAIKTIIYKNNKYVDKESLLAFLKHNHFTGTGVSNFQFIDGLIGSEEYLEAWNKYRRTVPDNKRIVREKASYDDLNSNDMKRIYNIYIQICYEELTEIPKLYPLNIFAKNFNMDHRSLLRYCQKGVLNFYKIGNKYMLSQNDYEKSFELIQRYKEKPKKKGLNRGKKSKYEELLIELNLATLIPNMKFRETVDFLVNSYFILSKIKTDNLTIKKFFDDNNLKDLSVTAEKQDIIIDDELKKIIDKIKEMALQAL